MTSNNLADKLRDCTKSNNPDRYLKEFLEILESSTAQEQKDFTQALDDDFDFEKEKHQTVFRREDSLIEYFYFATKQVPLKQRFALYEKYYTLDIAFKHLMIVMQIINVNQMNKYFSSIKTSTSVDTSSSDKKVQLLLLLNKLLDKEYLSYAMTPILSDYINGGENSARYETYNDFICEYFASLIKTETDNTKLEKVTEFWTKLMPEIGKRTMQRIFLDSKPETLERVNISRALLLLGETKFISTATENVFGDKIEVSVGNNNKLSNVNFGKNNRNFVNSNSELGQLIQELTLAVEKMAESLSIDEAQRASRALETIVSESKSAIPDRQWWEVSVEGLSKAAKNLDKIGEPVLEILAKVAPILLSMSK